MLKIAYELISVKEYIGYSLFKNNMPVFFYFLNLGEDTHCLIIGYDECQ